MKNAKLLTLISLVVITSALVDCLYFAQEVGDNCDEDCVLVELILHLTMAAVENRQQNMLSQEVPTVSRPISEQDGIPQQSLKEEKSIKNEQGGKKQYDDDRCHAKKELSESDY